MTEKKNLKKTNHCKLQTVLLDMERQTGWQWIEICSIVNYDNAKYAKHCRLRSSSMGKYYFLLIWINKDIMIGAVNNDSILPKNITKKQWIYLWLIIWNDYCLSHHSICVTFLRFNLENTEKAFCKRYLILISFQI